MQGPRPARRRVTAEEKAEQQGGCLLFACLTPRGRGLALPFCREAGGLRTLSTVPGGGGLIPGLCGKSTKCAPGPDNFVH